MLTYPSGRVVNFGYATGGGCCNSRLSSVADATTGTTLASSISFNAAGGKLSETLNPGSNAIVETFTYNNPNQLTETKATMGSTTLMDFTYAYGTSSTNTGRLLSRTDTVQPEHSMFYSYDSIYRLQQVVSQDTSWGIAWTFDAWGNRLTQTPEGLATLKVGTQTIGYTNNRNTSDTYDAAGNVTNDGSHSYMYNAENQMVTMDGGAATYAYDGAGRRMVKTVGSETDYSFYGGPDSGRLCEFTTTNTGATSASSSDHPFFHTTDHHGSAVLVITASGNMIENNRTLPHGEQWLTDVSSTNNEKFTSYQRDSESGLDYAMSRYFQSTTGSFQSPSQVPAQIYKPTSLNAYAYISADPINSVDPSGVHPEEQAQDGCTAEFLFISCTDASAPPCLQPEIGRGGIAAREVSTDCEGGTPGFPPRLIRVQRRRRSAGRMSRSRKARLYWLRRRRSSEIQSTAPIREDEQVKSIH